MKKKISYNLIALALVFVSFASTFAANNEARLLRFPSVGGDQIAFSYAGDLYSVSINGGTAKKLTGDIGYEMFSRFSPDGKTIAFTAQYDGNTEVYTIPSTGGVPKRITYTATSDRDQVGERMGPNNIVMCWTPDGEHIVFRSKWYDAFGLRGILFKVPVDGGELVQIPTTEGGFCSYSPDGKKLSMNRMYREFRTWKYYKGGQADDIWVNTVGTTELVNITNDPSQDIFPMWIGEDIYFLSDRDSIMNMFCYNTIDKQVKKVTNFDVYDCKFPSYSKDYIVFENGGYIYKFDVKNQKSEKVTIELNDEALYTRSKFSSKKSGGYSLSPDGERVLATVRGDIFSLPATIGATYNLTPSSASHERDPSWSPDGKHIAYFSDKTGEYQLYIMAEGNEKESTQLTNFKDGYLSGLGWSPDSKKVFFVTEKKEFYSIDIASKEISVVFKGDYGGVWGYDITKDGNWIAYSTSSKNMMSVIYLYDVKNKTHHPVTTTWFDSYSPTFSDDGKYLFFTSGRHFQPRYSAVEWNASYSVDSYLFVLPLAKNTPNPTLIEGDEYKLPEAKPEEDLEKDSKKKNDKKEDLKKEEKIKIVVDLDGIVERSTALPLESGRYWIVGCFNDELYFVKGGETKKISLKTMKVDPVTKESIRAFTPDFKKAVISKDKNIYVVPTTSFKADKSVPTADARVLIDYPQEWEQIFNETWRIYRDYFYVKNMHGKDWEGIREKYAVLLPYVRHRQDLTYIIGEMIGELNVGHAYITTGEAPAPEKIKTGLLGGKFSKDKSGYFQIDMIFKGVSWGTSDRSPLGEPGLGVKEGDYILEINNVCLKNISTIYEPLVGKVGSVIALKVNSKPSLDGAKTIYVKPISDESQLYYYQWVQDNIRKVSEASKGQIGYIHIPDMGPNGLDAFTKLFYTQLDKKALIIDDRMNGGGNVSPMILERLQREAYRINMYRNGSIDPIPVPNQTHVGPKVCLIDKYASSDGDLFAYGFRKLKLGKIIGTRSWGGIVGISGSKPYVDGQDVRTPFFTSYSMDGEWIIEDFGIEPDITVDINPFKDYLGIDAQLNKAIEVLMEDLKDYKPLAPIPADPIR